MSHQYVGRHSRPSGQPGDESTVGAARSAGVLLRRAIEVVVGQLILAAIREWLR
jgi:hypothetical protein